MASYFDRLLDPKVRGARKAAKLRLKEAKKLLRRARHAVAPEIRDEVQQNADTLSAALVAGKVARINKSADKLGNLLNKHLDIYRKPAWRESLESIGMAVLVALLLRSFVVEAFKIPSGSMIPTLAIGDQIFVNKYVYGVRVPFTAIRLVDFALPERGDVVVFICPLPPNDDYIKRVIGLPGDEIMVRGGVVHVNGEPASRRSLGSGIFTDRDGGDHWTHFEAEAFEETLGNHTYMVLQDTNQLQTAQDHGPVTVPEGHLFMMGDNRDHSYDSRSWGFVPARNVLGRSLFVWWSWGKEGLDSDRLGTWIE